MDKLFKWWPWVAFLAKWGWRVFLTYLWVAFVFGYPVPTRDTGMNWLIDFETWLANNVHDPILAAFVVGLTFSTWIIPGIWKLAKRYLPVTASLDLYFDPTSCVNLNTPGVKRTYVFARNDGLLDVDGVQVICVEVKFRAPGEHVYKVIPTFLSRVNLSWCTQPDGGTTKYAAIQMAHGTEWIDFLCSPGEVLTARGDAHFNQMNNRPFFTLRVDPRHAGIGRFFEKGTYRFVLQISALNVPAKTYVLLVEWDGTPESLTIRPENDAADSTRSRRVLRHFPFL